MSLATIALRCTTAAMLSTSPGLHRRQISVTIAAIGGIRPSPRFEMTLEDPVLGRTLRHAYDVHALPIVT